MQKMLVSFPDIVFAKLRALIPEKKRSKMISELVEKELAKREAELYRCAVAIEKDEALNKEMQEWESVTGDGIETETW